MHAVEDVSVDGRIDLLELADQALHLQALGVALVVADASALGQPAGAAQEGQAVVVAPADDLLLVHLVQRADQLHPRHVVAVQLGHHALNLGAVEHAHQDRLDHVVEVVPQRDLVAAAAAGFAVEVPAAHLCAHVARRAAHGRDGIEDVRLEDLDGDVQPPGVFDDAPPVFRRVAGIHHEEGQREVGRAVALQFLHTLGQQHGILPAGDAHGDSVAVVDEPVVLQRRQKRPPDALSILLRQRAFNLLIKLHAFAPRHLFFQLYP